MAHPADPPRSRGCPPAPKIPTVRPLAVARVTTNPDELWRVAKEGQELSFYVSKRPGGNRFDPLPAPDSGVGVLYMATSPDAAMAEALLRWHDDVEAGARVELERSRFESKKIYGVGLKRALNLVDCTGLGVAALQQTLAISAPPGWKAEDIFQCSSLHYASTQQWAQWMRHQVPAADGLLWMSRQFNSEKCIVLFGDRCDAADLTCDDGNHEGELTDPRSPAYRRLKAAIDALGWTADL